MKEILKKIFGYSSFRQGQEEIANNIINGRDILAVMPTGAGKSLCYQIPALKMDGITIVVSPLISLMTDQVRTLIENGVRAAYFNSALTQKQYMRALENAKKYTYKIIYVAPERLMTRAFLDFALSVKISMVAVDEAHCISQWGHDFRPSYLKIKDFVETLPKRPVVTAFTATATQRVKIDIESKLGLVKPYKITTGYDRQNLYFSVIKTSEKTDETLRILKKHKDESGIIYCISRRAVDELTMTLKAKGYSVAKYHAGLEDSERKESQNAFITGEVNIIIATNAFGMGIDKPDVRYVLHYNMPMSMEAYYQEAGRAGRDGENAKCIMLYSFGDYCTNEFLINLVDENENLTRDEKDNIKAKSMYRLDKIKDYATSKHCLRGYILNYFGEKVSIQSNCGNCSVCCGKKATYTNEPIMHNYDNSGYTHIENRALFKRLKAITLEIAKKEHIASYAVLNDSVLWSLAFRKPASIEEIAKIEGMGTYKVRKYGEIYIRIIREWKESL